MHLSGFMTDSIKTKIMAAIFNAANGSPPAMPTPPTTLYFGLSQTPPTRAGGYMEVTGTNYGRTAISSTSVNWTATGTQEANAAKINLPVPGATWKTAVGWFLIDSASGAGTVWFAGSLSPVTFVNTSTPNIAIDALIAQL